MYCKHLRIRSLDNVPDGEHWNGIAKYKMVYTWKSIDELDEDSKKTFLFMRESYEDKCKCDCCYHSGSDEFIECYDKCS